MPRGDGRLSQDLDPQRPGPQDACGVFGVWAPGEEVAKLTYFGLYALQHRGQEAAGIAVSDGSGVVVYKDLGLVAQVFDEPTLASLRGHLAIGHARYSTTGGSTWENAQPTIQASDSGTTIALAHNGNLVNTADLAAQVASKDGSTSDTALVTALLVVSTRGASPALQAVAWGLPAAIGTPLIVRVHSGRRASAPAALAR